MKIDQVEILIETLIRRRMKAGDAGLRKKSCWFDDSESRLVRNKIRQDISKFNGRIQNPSEFIDRAIHRHCLELIRNKENLKKETKYPAPKLDMKKDLELFLNENGGEKFIIDWIFRDRQDAKDERHKNLRGLNYIGKKLPGLPKAVHEDMYGEEMLQLIEALRKSGHSQWRGKHGAASVIDYLKAAFCGIYADVTERGRDDLKHRRFDYTQHGHESKIMAGPGGESKGERTGDPGRAGFWTKRASLDFREPEGSKPDQAERIAREVFRINHPDHFSETINRSKGTGETHQDHWLDYYQARCLFSGAPALAVEDENFSEWQQSTYWQFPEQVCERNDLYNKAFDSSEYDPEKSYKENLNQAKKKKTLRYIGILGQKYGEDWDDKEIAEFWPPHIIERTSQIKGLIRSQKKLIRKDFERFGYIRPPVVFKFRDCSGRLFYDPIKRSDKEMLEGMSLKPGDGYFKGKLHFKKWRAESTAPKESGERENVSSYLQRGGATYIFPPAEIDAQRFPKKKSGIYLKHFNLINKVVRLKKKHASKYKICVKCGAREQRRKTRIINGLRYCLVCWGRLKT